MPALIRRSKLVALLLLLLTPGLGGWAVQALHPCPADMPSAAAGAASDQEHEHGHQGGPTHSGHTAECRCIGSCHATPLAQARPAPVVEVPVAFYVIESHHPAGARLPDAGRLPDLHPPATAPPLG
jgi:hypothetical protein